MKYGLFHFLVILVFSISCQAQNKANTITGKWMSSENNLEVEVFKQGNEFKGRLLWFDDSDDKTKPVNVRLDEKNSDKALRTRKLIGIEVLNNLQYNPDDDEWQDGIIYDGSSGKQWDAKAWINSDGMLKVRGYWHFSFLGQTMSFKRVN